MLVSGTRFTRYVMLVHCCIVASVLTIHPKCGEWHREICFTLIFGTFGKIPSDQIGRTKTQFDPKIVSNTNIIYFLTKKTTVLGVYCTVNFHHCYFFAFHGWVQTFLDQGRCWRCYAKRSWRSMRSGCSAWALQSWCRAWRFARLGALVAMWGDPFPVVIFFLG